MFDRFLLIHLNAGQVRQAVVASYSKPRLMRPLDL